MLVLRISISADNTSTNSGSLGGMILTVDRPLLQIRFCDIPTRFEQEFSLSLHFSLKLLRYLELALFLQCCLT
jgi:hypothetical protein